MKVNDMIYLQTCGSCECHKVDPQECVQCEIGNPVDPGSVTWSQERIFVTDKVYFSEDAVRNLLRDEYKQCAGLIKKATKIDGIVKIEESVESAIRKLKGGEK